MKIKVLDNFLPHHQYEQLSSVVNDKLYWSWCPNITERGVADSKERGQFVHMLYDINVGISSNFYPEIDPIIQKFAMLFAKTHRNIILYRAKVNLNPREEGNYQLGNYHVDFDYDCMTAIYYVNSNNGYTKFKDGTKVDSVENRMVLFKSHHEHVGFTCSDEKCRLLINFNFAVPNK